MNLSREVGAAAATMLLSTAMITGVQAAAALDSSFGTGGKVVMDFLRDFGLVRFNGAVATRPPVTRRPVADAYVRGGASASANFGTAAQLLAKLGVSDDNSRISYLKFDLRDIASVGRATLRLNGRLSNTTNSSVQTTVRAVSSTSWDERTVTWRNRPAIGTVLGSFTVRGTTAQWHEVDLTAYIQAEKRAGRDVVALALQNTTHSSAQVQAASREAGAQAPALIVQP